MLSFQKATPATKAEKKEESSDEDDSDDDEEEEEKPKVRQHAAYHVILGGFMCHDVLYLHYLNTSCD